MLKNEYINELIPNIFKENMRKYFEKNISEVIKTENGFLISFGKPDIKTRFCFSYDEHTSGSIEAAQEACDMKEDAFIYENTKELKEKIKRFEEAEKVFFVTDTIKPKK